MNAREHRGPRGLVGALQAAAVRRWPAHLRDEQCREWTAELEALRNEPRSGLRRLRFVLSLAVGPVPWARPITVTVAVRLLYLLAALQVVGLAVQLDQAGTIVDATAAAYRGKGDEESVSVTTTVAAVLAGLFAIAARSRTRVGRVSPRDVAGADPPAPRSGPPGRRTVRARRGRRPARG